MAHADYDCCAICDSKQSYKGFDAETKQEICSSCVANLAKQGIILPSVDELIKWVKREKPKKLFLALEHAGFQFCFYQNDVDNEITKKGIFPKDKKNRYAGIILKKEHENGKNNN